MTSEPRKASDILLELETKLDAALSIIHAQDLNIKILSNKLNVIIEALEKKEAAPRVVVEAVPTKAAPISPFQAAWEQDAEKNVPIHAEMKLPLEAEPQGFRRTSRPETFAGDDVYLPGQQPANTPKYPVQVPAAPPGRNPGMQPPPGRSAAEATVSVPAPKPEPEAQKAPPQNKPQVTQTVLHNAVPVEQRAVNAQGKSLFLAEVEIIDLSTMQQVYKTKTNGSGKWMASLGIGNYRVIIRKYEPTTKERMEVTQEIQVDGTQSPLTLQTIIIKS